MKQRLLVMNGQRLIQSEQGGEWSTDKVEKAGMIKPGIYPLYLSKQADKDKSHEGVVLHSDNAHVYQQIGKNLVKHDRADFDKVPVIGSHSRIDYNDVGKVIAVPTSTKLGRGMTR